MTNSKNDLGLLTCRTIREHQVLHVSAELASVDGVMDSARVEIVNWARRRSGSMFPPEALEGRSFERLAAGRSSIAVEVVLPEIQAWALRQEDPDKTVAGRIWTSEAILWRTANQPVKFAARLIVGTAEAELDIVPAAPGYIRQLVDTLGLTIGGQALSSSPWYVDDPKAQDAFLEVLADPARRLPMIVFSVADQRNRQSSIDLKKMAAALCGVASVVAIPPEVSWALTDRFTKRLSVFDQGVRVYLPGFDEEADPYSHPLWVGTRLDTPAGANLVDVQIRTRVAQFSILSVRIGTDILPFAHLRSVSREAEQKRLTSIGASDSEKLSAAEHRIAALAREVTEARDFELYALDEQRRAEARAAEAESREHKTTAQIQNLLQRLAAVGADNCLQNSLPQKWDDFDDWCSQELVGRVRLTRAATRGCKKALFTDVGQAARCLLWLATECRNRLLEGGGSLRDEQIEDGIRNTACGSDEFEFDWQSQRLAARWHVKTGGNSRAPENCLRIYYAWDEQTQQVIVADMPGHRKSGAS